MLIYSHNPYYVSDFKETIIRAPDSPEYELPVVLIDHRSVTPQDEEMLQLLAEHPPHSRFKRGDIALLHGDIPHKMRLRMERIPRAWEVRFVVSRWAMELMLTLHSQIQVGGADHLRAIIESHGGLSAPKYSEPILYCHGYPHGMYPNTTAYLREWNVKRLTVRDPVQPWRHIVEEAGAQFYGYDSSQLVRPYNFELAPDDYSKGASLKHPFQHEEPNVEMLCLSGLEEYLFDPIIIGQKRRVKTLDEDHDIFVR